MTWNQTSMTSSKRTLHIDIETYSSVDLAQSGVYRYAESPDFKILLFGYAWEDGPVKVIDMTKEELPKGIQEALTSDEVIKVAHNANFERVCLSRLVLAPHKYLDPTQWRDTMIMASELGYPASLAQLGSALGLEEDKKKLTIGKRLIQYFCKPCKPTKANGGRARNLPEHDLEKWQLFIEYNQRDVEAEQAIYAELTNPSRYVQMEDKEWDAWFTDQAINDQGILIDREIVENVLKYSIDHSQGLMNEAKRITQLDNPQSIAQLKGWLDKRGIQVDSLNKTAVKELLKDVEDDDVRRVLEIRQELGKTSVKKYDAIYRCVCSDNRVHGAFQFYGGRTGRWAGRLIQPQNFPRPSFDEVDAPRRSVKKADWRGLELIYDSMNDVFATLIRTVIVPPKGKSFVVADYSAIEARVIAWLTRETWRQEVFKNGGDIYCASASQMFGVPVEKHGVNGHLRQKGKIAELALGYGGGTAALEAFGASKMGLDKSQQEDIVKKWRQASPRIKKFWYTLGKAFEDAIHGQTTLLDRNMIVYRLGNSVYIKLPSGRSIAYVSPRIKDGQAMYLGLNQTTRQWGWIKTWGGKLTENVVQSIARDCLVETLLDIDDFLMVDTVMHVHDEVICEAKTEKAQELYQGLLDIMSRPIEWAPDLVLVGDGFISDYYKKD